MSYDDFLSEDDLENLDITSDYSEDELPDHTLRRSPKFFEVAHKNLSDAALNLLVNNLLKNISPTCKNRTAIINSLKKAHPDRDEYVAVVYEFVAKAQVVGVTEAYNLLRKNALGFGGEAFREAVDLENKEISKLETPIEVVEGIYTCHKCKGKKTHSYSVQLRSCDEPPTVIITCMNQLCMFKWRQG
jgi:DNA-directed RNA polymerase subunit M/transcription elongation factor TFIIS